MYTANNHKAANNKPDNYQTIARYYDFFTAWALKAVRQKVIALCLQEFKNQGLCNILDLGSGTGKLAFDFCKQGNFRVTGLELSKSMLGAMQRPSAAGLHPDFVHGYRAADLHPDFVHGYREADLHPDFVHGSIDALPFKNNSFDLALLCLVLHETDAELEQTLKEASRVAKNILIVDYRLPERNLELPATYAVHLPELLAGKAHYANFKSYMKNGALQSISHYLAYDLQLKCKAESTLGYGALGLVLHSQ